MATFEYRWNAADAQIDKVRFRKGSGQTLTLYYPDQAKPGLEQNLATFRNKLAEHSLGAYADVTRDGHHVLRVTDFGEPEQVFELMKESGLVSADKEPERRRVKKSEQEDVKPDHQMGFKLDPVKVGSALAVTGLSLMLMQGYYEKYKANQLAREIRGVEGAQSPLGKIGQGIKDVFTDKSKFGWREHQAMQGKTVKGMHLEWPVSIDTSNLHIAGREIKILGRGIPLPSKVSFSRQGDAGSFLNLFPAREISYTTEDIVKLQSKGKDDVAAAIPYVVAYGIKSFMGGGRVQLSEGSTLREAKNYLERNGFNLRSDAAADSQGWLSPSNGVAASTGVINKVQTLLKEHPIQIVDGIAFYGSLKTTQGGINRLMDGLNSKDADGNSKFSWKEHVALNYRLFGGAASGTADLVGWLFPEVTAEQAEALKDDPNPIKRSGAYRWLIQQPLALQQTLGIIDKPFAFFSGFHTENTVFGQLGVAGRNVLFASARYVIGMGSKSGSSKDYLDKMDNLIAMTAADVAAETADYPQQMRDDIISNYAAFYESSLKEKRFIPADAKDAADQIAERIRTKLAQIEQSPWLAAVQDKGQTPVTEERPLAIETVHQATVGASLAADSEIKLDGQATKRQVDTGVASPQAPVPDAVEADTVENDGVLMKPPYEDPNAPAKLQGNPPPVPTFDNTPGYPDYQTPPPNRPTYPGSTEPIPQMPSIVDQDAAEQVADARAAERTAADKAEETHTEPSKERKAALNEAVAASHS